MPLLARATQELEDLEDEDAFDEGAGEEDAEEEELSEDEVLQGGGLQQSEHETQQLQRQQQQQQQLEATKGSPATQGLEKPSPEPTEPTPQTGAENNMPEKLSQQEGARTSEHAEQAPATSEQTEHPVSGHPVKAAANEGSAAKLMVSRPQPSGFAEISGIPYIQV